MRRVGKKAAGRELDGRTWDEYPDAGHVSQRLDGSDGDEEAAMTPEVKAELELLNQVRALVHGTPYWRKINDAKLRRLFINDQPSRREG